MPRLARPYMKKLKFRLHCYTTLGKDIHGEKKSPGTLLDSTGHAEEDSDKFWKKCVE